MKNIKPKTKIKYKANEGDKWESPEITKRAAKASGKNCHWWNIKNLSGNEQSLNLEQIYDFEKQQNISQESDRYWSITRQKPNTRNTPCKKQIRYSKGQTSRTRSVEERRLHVI